MKRRIRLEILLRELYSSNIDTLKQLNEKGRALRTEILISLGLLDQPHSAQVESNLPWKLSGICTHLQEVVKGVFRFKRTPAMHIFVLMISSELCNKKPYAVPVQFFLYAGFKEVDMRRIVTQLVQEMVCNEMKVAGKFCIICYSMFMHVHVCLFTCTCIISVSSMMIYAFPRFCYQW